VAVCYVLMQRSSVYLSVKQTGDCCGKWQSHKSQNRSARIRCHKHRLPRRSGEWLQWHKALAVNMIVGFLRGAKDMWKRFANIKAGNVVCVMNRT